MVRILSMVMICAGILTHANCTSAGVPSNKIFNELLRKHVNEAGWVDYKGFIKEKDKFQQYLDALSNNPPGKDWSSNETEAYWINVYNAFTIKLIMDHYPVKSIKDIGPKHQVVYINTPWQKKFFRIGHKRYKLDKVENRELRSRFKDARIHFAIVCASRSCARLRNEAYEGSTLDAQLNDQAKDFLRDKRKNTFSSSSKAELSPYFDWFKKDFTRQGTVVSFINKYAPLQLKEDADIAFKDYDWSLNEQR